MRKIFWVSIVTIACFGLTNQTKAQIVVDNTITVNDLVNDYLVGENVQIFNILLNGVPGDQAYLNAGLFNSTNSNIPIENGIVLSTGDCNNVIGPNDAGGSSMPGDAPDYNDADLDSIASGTTNDETVLEFDFVPQGEVVLFRYVFSSEEYNEYVCSSFNDAFGFFLSGPGLNGPYTNDGVNIAIIPGVELPVTINTLNNGSIGSNGREANCPDPEFLASSEYFVDNANNPDFSATQMDGFSVVLEARANVVCGAGYHIKMAISDVSDGAFDSAVFLESGSFGAIPIVEIDIETPTDSSLVGEGCQIDFVFNRLLNAEADTVELFVTGEAESGVDFLELPSHIIFEAGQSTYTLPIVGIYDEIEEGTEDLTLLMKFFSCGDTLEFSATAFIEDAHPLSIDMGGPSSICEAMGDSATMTADVSGGYGELTYYWTAGSVDTISTIPTDPMDPMNQNPKDAPELYSYNWLTVVDECGLWINSDKGYYTENNCPILAYNVFTPNNDGINEYFILENIELFPGSQLVVYDRWGTLVYQSENYQNDWDGKNKSGKVVTDGVYFWVLTLREPEVEGSQLKGNVTILTTSDRK